jgi:hypothetical protein
MNREVHVRFCEGRGVRLPPATRPEGTISDMFRQQRRPTLSTVQAVCGALDLSLGDVIRFTAPDRQPPGAA